MTNWTSQFFADEEKRREDQAALNQRLMAEHKAKQDGSALLWEELGTKLRELVDQFNSHPPSSTGTVELVHAEDSLCIRAVNRTDLDYSIEIRRGIDAFSCNAKLGSDNKARPLAFGNGCEDPPAKIEVRLDGAMRPFLCIERHGAGKETRTNMTLIGQAILGPMFCRILRG